MYQDQNISEIEQDLFTEEDVLSIRYASTLQRFLNYVIDIGTIQFISIGLDWFLVKMQLIERTGAAFNLFSGVIYIIAYYTLCEKAFKGCTVGKLLTGTRAVSKNGQELSFKEALMRSLSRIVPFEPFSAFNGHPWHDEWTNTMVIKTR